MGQRIPSSFNNFSEELAWTFAPAKLRKEAAQQLSRFSQGNRSVAKNATEFHTMVAARGWNETALFDMFYAGLADKIKDEMALRKPTPNNLMTSLR